MDGIYIYTYGWNVTQPLKNEIMPFSATWMNLEIIILSEASLTKTIYYYIWNLKKKVQINLVAKRRYK